MPFQLRSTGRTNGSSAAASASSGRKRASNAAIITSAARPAPSSHLHRDAEALLRQRRAIDALGAGLHEHARAEARHDLGAEAAGAGDVPGMRGAGLAQPRRGAGAVRRTGRRRVPKRAKPCASAVSGIAQVGTEQPSMAQTSAPAPRRSGPPARRRPRAAPDGRLDVAARRSAPMRAGDAEKARVLARAVVVQRARRAAARAPAPAPTARWIGQCAPHSSAPASSPAQRQHPRRRRDMAAARPNARRRPAPAPRRPKP